MHARSLKFKQPLKWKSAPVHPLPSTISLPLRFVLPYFIPSHSHYTISNSLVNRSDLVVSLLRWCLLRANRVWVSILGGFTGLRWKIPQDFVANSKVTIQICRALSQSLTKVFEICLAHVERGTPEWLMSTFKCTRKRQNKANVRTELG